MGNSLQPMKKAQPLSPLRLINCKHIYIGDSCFYRLWTSACQELEINIQNISKDWCDFVIKYCNCSNVSYLQLINVTFDKKSVNDLVLAKFASKFTNVRRLILNRDRRIDSSVLSLLQFLQPVLLKNKCQLQLNMDAFCQFYCVTFKLYVEYNVAPYELNISLDLRTKLTQHYERIKDFQMNRMHTDTNITYLQRMWADLGEAAHGVAQLLMYSYHRFNARLGSHNRCGCDGGLLHSFLSQLSFDAHIFDDNHLSDINDFLGLKTIIDNKLFDAKWNPN